MRLQSESPPNAADGGLAQPGLSRQHTAGPVRRALRRFLQCQSYHPLDLVVADLARRSRTRLIPESCNAVGDETVAPQPNCETGTAQLRRHGCIAGSGGALQNDPGAKCCRPGTARLPRHTLQLHSLACAHNQFMLLRTSTMSCHDST